MCIAFKADSKFLFPFKLIDYCSLRPYNVTTFIEIIYIFKGHSRADVPQRAKGFQRVLGANPLKYERGMPMPVC